MKVKIEISQNATPAVSGQYGEITPRIPSIHESLAVESAAPSGAVESFISRHLTLPTQAVQEARIAELEEELAAARRDGKRLQDALTPLNEAQTKMWGLLIKCWGHFTCRGRKAPEGFLGAIHDLRKKYGLEG